jgi:hypothetical protein
MRLHRPLSLRGRRRRRTGREHYLGDLMNRAGNLPGHRGGTADRHHDKRGSGGEPHRRDLAHPSAMPWPTVYAAELVYRTSLPSEFGMRRLRPKRLEKIVNAARCG